MGAWPESMKVRCPPVSTELWVLSARRVPSPAPGCPPTEPSLGQSPPAGPHLPLPGSVTWETVLPTPLSSIRPTSTSGDTQSRGAGGPRALALTPGPVLPAFEAGPTLVLIFFVLLFPPLSSTIFFSFRFSSPVLLQSSVPFPLCVCEKHLKARKLKPTGPPGRTAWAESVWCDSVLLGTVPGPPEPAPPGLWPLSGATRPLLAPLVPSPDCPHPQLLSCAGSVCPGVFCPLFCFLPVSVAGVLPLRLHPAPGAPLMPSAEVVETGYWPSQFGAPPVSSP